MTPPQILNTFPGRFVAVCYVMFFIAWVAGAFWKKRTAHQSGGWGRSTIIATAVGVVLLVVINRIAPISRSGVLWSYSQTIGAAAMLFTSIGVVLLLWARLILASNWSMDVVIRENHELVQHGPYCYVRHPIYTGFILMTAGGMLLSLSAISASSDVNRRSTSLNGARKKTRSASTWVRPSDSACAAKYSFHHLTLTVRIAPSAGSL